jgi:hypothetical protein
MTFAGTLTLDFANGFGAANDSFDLFDFAQPVGDFSAVTFVDPGYAGTFNPTNGVLTLTSVPEPTSVMLLGIAGALALSRRRRVA